MRRILLLTIVAGLAFMGAHEARSQEIGLATYQETAQVIIDKTISNSVTASITLQSTSVQELQVPAALEQRIREDGRISAVVLTNEERCVLGVAGESCIMINMKRDPADTSFPEIQDAAREASAAYIDAINGAFDTDAEFHSVFVHSGDRTSEILGTSGVVSGGGTVSAVYTMPMESTGSMYEKVSSILVPRAIREAGGFYDAARNLSLQDNAKMTFSLIPLENNSLLQLKASVGYAGTAAGITDVSPLEYLRAGELERSGYFSSGFYPLNSILQVVVLSPEPARASDVRGGILETAAVGGEMLPTDVTVAGWVFDPREGEKIQAKWIFGKEASVDAGSLAFSLGVPGQAAGEPPALDESAVVAVIIAVVAAAAAAFYLRGYRRQSHQ